jgi:hypothetical protein
VTVEAQSARRAYEPYDLLTLVCVSALAYVVAVALHEHAGHAAACLALGGRIKELGAFYVDCDNAMLSDGEVRLVALAGPALSLLTGALSLKLLARLPSDAHIAQYFTWLLATVALLAATGYLLFSGISGVGDLGATPEGAFYNVEPEWLWRASITLMGAGLYILVALISLRQLEQRIPGFGAPRIAYVRRMMLIAYASGAIASILIGLLNPHGLYIVLASAVASSLGATSALLWMPQWLSPTRTGDGSGFGFARDWRWIAVALAVVLLYGTILGPTLRP